MNYSCLLRISVHLSFVDQRLSSAAVSVILRERSRTRFPRLQGCSRDTRHFVVW